jgi:hypothetical protein
VISNIQHNLLCEVTALDEARTDAAKMAKNAENWLLNCFLSIKF